jgi:hypothetical protein
MCFMTALGLQHEVAYRVGDVRAVAPQRHHRVGSVEHVSEWRPLADLAEHRRARREAELSLTCIESYT